MNTDAKFSGSIFRKDNPQIISSNRQLAVLHGIRLAYSATGYKAGRVLARNSVSGIYDAYDSAGASGLDVAKAILLEGLQAEDTVSASGAVVPALFGGEVFKDKLVGLDSDAITDLDAKTIIDGSGTQILKF